LDGGLSGWTRRARAGQPHLHYITDQRHQFDIPAIGLKRRPNTLDQVFNGFSTRHALLKSTTDAKPSGLPSAGFPARSTKSARELRGISRDPYRRLRIE